MSGPDGNRNLHLNCSEAFFFDENVTNRCRPICGEFSTIPLGALIIERGALVIGFIAAATVLVLAVTVQRDTL